MSEYDSTSELTQQAEFKQVLPNVVTRLVAERVGESLSPIAKEQLLALTAHVEIFTDMTHYRAFLDSEAGAEFLKGETVSDAVSEERKKGFLKKRGKYSVLFTKFSDRRKFLHEVSHLCDSFISDLIKLNSCNSPQALELVRDLSIEKTKIKKLAEYRMIATISLYVSLFLAMLIIGNLQSQETSPTFKEQLVALMPIVPAVLFNLGVQFSYERLGAEKRARATENREEEFFSESEMIAQDSTIEKDGEDE